MHCASDLCNNDRKNLPQKDLDIPYEALFGCHVKVVLIKSSLPQYFVEHVEKEDALQEIVN